MEMLVQKLNGVLDRLYSLFVNKKLEITLVGLNGAGKTTLSAYIEKKCFSELIVPTVGFEMCSVRKKRVLFKIWDLGGQKRFRPLWERYSREADVIVFVVDSTEHASIATAQKELHALLETSALIGIPLFVVLSKCDRANSMPVAEAAEALHLSSIISADVQVHCISCKTGAGVEQLVDGLSRKAHRR